MPLSASPKPRVSITGLTLENVLALIGWILFGTAAHILLIASAAPRRCCDYDRIVKLLLEPAGFFLTASWIMSGQPWRAINRLWAALRYLWKKG